MRALLLFGVAAASRTTLDLYVASKCPDAARCELSFLPDVLGVVGELVDLRLGFIAEPNASEPLGYTCMHGESECIGNLVQLCAEAHFPRNVNIDARALPGALLWTRFLECAGTEGTIPGNTDACLASVGVPEALMDDVHACVEGGEGRSLMNASVARTLAACGHHSAAPRRGCKSCSMFLDGEPACVVDGGEWYNCSVEPTADAWVGEICRRADGAPPGASPPVPLACRLGAGASTAPLPRVWGHSYASLDPEASAAFVETYLGGARAATLAPACDDGDDGGGGAPLEVETRLARFDDFRGGGLALRFVRNPRKPGGDYGVAELVASMRVAFGNLSDNRAGHQWNQYFDDHVAFFVPSLTSTVAALLRDGVPFFVTQSDGLYESVYVELPATGKVVEVLGDFVLGSPLPPTHVRLSSTQQFCTPKRRRDRRRRLGADRPAGRDSPFAWDTFGPVYAAGDADGNKTTIAGADPDAAVDFAVAYLGASRVEQKRGPEGDGDCAKLAWAQFRADAHQWHVVDARRADWVTRGGGEPGVPYNISQLAAYVEGLRDLDAGVYDQYLDYRDVFAVPDLTPLATVLRDDAVPFGVWARPWEGSCSLLVDVPRNGVAVEIRSETWGGWLSDACAARSFDLCATD